MKFFDLHLHRRDFLFLNFYLLISLILPNMTSSESLSPSKNVSSGPVVPTTPLVVFLERLQSTAFDTFGDKHFDAKFYIDLSLKFNLSAAEEAFDGLPRGDNGTVPAKDLGVFVAEYFEDAGEDVEYYDPPDFVAEPEGFLPAVENPVVRGWAIEVHSLWKNLSRKVSDDVKEHPGLHTLLPLPAPVIVPGSRFREVYYWDSYWVISQPPLLSAMVYEIYNRTKDMKFAKQALPSLLKEHQFWNSEVHKVIIKDGEGNNHTLNRYYAMWNKPRPESFIMDKNSSSKLNSSEKQQFYRNVASAAESGWDFSTRWMRNSSEFTTLATTSVLPVDLNVFILKMEQDIAFLAKETGEENIAESFLEASKARKKSINSVFWNQKMGQWVDYWLNNGDTFGQISETWQASNQNQNVFASNFSPLWSDLFNSDLTLVENVKKSLENSGLLQPAGIATSLTNSGQQWDFPNGWAPLQHMIVEGLAKSGSQEAKSLAEDIVARWIRTNYIAFKKTGAMHEKYDVQKCGEAGGGGEYKAQTGFGWSNGVVLSFLEEFGWPQNQRIDC
ncbi:trehalase isoform X2 [Euphorbia lathyris]|uniref:trehalase isoform X2 n=1 Tax=Euphorbia lathyris TaxID=212925 RepID=UPI0033136166